MTISWDRKEVDRFQLLKAGHERSGLATFDWRLFLGRLGINANHTMIKSARRSGRVFDRTGVPVELSYAKGSIQDAARELGVDPGRISK